jgi:hypothetical protein
MRDCRQRCRAFRESQTIPRIALRDTDRITAMFTAESIEERVPFVAWNVAVTRRHLSVRGRR